MSTLLAAIDGGLDWWRWLGLGIVFASLIGCWFLARMGRLGPAHLRKRIDPRLVVSESRSVGNRTFVTLVEVDGRSFLLAHQSGGGVAWQRLEAAQRDRRRP
jgi:flagellar biogenesis protein FliO